MGTLYLEDLAVGQSAELKRTVTDADVRGFAEVTGDENPVHLDEAYAATTRFKGRVAHGMLLGGHISAVLAGRLPGPGVIYISQHLTFRRPIRIGDEVTTRATVTKIDPRRAFVTLATVCEVGGKVVVDGEAVVLAPRRDGGGR
jgi:3-hydroxybutyryl-CoA dehydratase